MGQTLVRLAGQTEGIALAGEVDQGDDLAAAMADCDAAIEFAHHSVTPRVAHLGAQGGQAVVIGTTGHNSEELRAIHAASAKVPVVHAPNFAVAVNVLFYLARLAGKILGPDYEREIVEIHHRMKVDAPSGTAKRLGEVLAETLGLDYDGTVKHGRVGETGVRTKTEIGMHALRGGDVVGEHTAYFFGIGERLELTLRSSSRESFAAGALRAAAWAVRQPPGRYSMEHVLGLPTQ
jgi:4-hydroxy-tetrahydrodipicolinate reductase